MSNKEKNVLHNEKLHLYSKLRLKLKKIHRVLEFNQSQWQSQWLKPYVGFDTQKRTKSGKNDDQVGKTLSKLMNNAAHGKTMENLRNNFNAKLVCNKKDYLKWTSKANYM